MNTRIRNSAALILGAVSLAFSQAAWSMGLGDATVDSFLDQPLVAHIELITKETDDLDSVSVGLASAEDYELIGASLDDITVPLSFAVVSSDGQARIAVTSTLPVNNPVVRLIIEVNWTGGRMLREYTLFLDPATFSQQAPAPRIEAEPAPVQEPPVAREDGASQAQQPSAAPPRQATPETAAPAAEASAGFGADEYGPVKSGDTLWEIARDWSAVNDQNINKVMLAIQRKNPRAFSRNNINLLQRGAILRMPEAHEVNAMSVAEANGEVTEQAAAWESRENMASSSTPLLSDDVSTPEPLYGNKAEELASESDAAAAAAEPEEELVAESESEISDSMEVETEPQLELVPPSEDSTLDSAYGFEESEEASEASVTAQSLREELARKEEELITQQQQNAYLEQRMSELESQLAESREGTVDDENLSTMEERLRKERLAAENADAESSKDADSPGKEQEAAPPKVRTSPPDEPWYSGLTWWLLGLLVLVAAGAGWFMSRRDGSDDDFDAAYDSGDAEETLRDIKSEAEDVLKVLDSGTSDAAEEESKAEDSAPDDDISDEAKTQEVAQEAAQEETREEAEPARKSVSPVDEDAEVLDEDSADPEIQLDLARAYISMGDKEAARVILEEVIAHGDEEQQAEASKMKDFL